MAPRHDGDDPRPLADEPIDVERAIKILLVHDIVEIDAGDVFIYDDAQRAAAEAAEQEAADRIFGLLPAEQGAEFRALWDEYEDRSTPKAGSPMRVIDSNRCCSTSRSAAGVGATTA